MDITKIDPNFAVKTVNEDGLVYYNCLERPFQIYGLLTPDGESACFLRMPQKIADTVSEKVAHLTKNSAGGRVRFITDSRRIAIRAKLQNVYRAPHFTMIGSAGFDMYDGTHFVGSFEPPIDLTDGYSSEIKLTDRKMREITIHFPLYTSVQKLEIGLEEGTEILAPKPYRVELPVVYYGSSITQGGCASRPGCSYESMISRSLDCDYINLGFSGSAKAELPLAEYIAKLKMSAFVFDYDHNASTVAYLKETHERMFRIIREANPTLPIIIVSKPHGRRMTENVLERRDVIMQTYLNARNQGDTNVYFLDGSSMLQIFGGDSGTVDGIHPNDLGFACMAKVIGAALEHALGISA